jgi:hypothetical protein
MIVNLPLDVGPTMRRGKFRIGVLTGMIPDE